MMKSWQGKLDEDLAKWAGDGNLAMVEELLAAGADPKARISELRGRTALMEAAAEGMETCVAALLGKSDLRAQDRNGETALMLATRGPKFDPRMVELLAPGSDLGQRDSQGLTAMLWAAWMGRGEAVRALLPWSGAGEVDRDGRAPLMLAAAEGNVECARALVGASDALAKDCYGKTALMLAIESGVSECVSLLLPLSDLAARTARSEKRALHIAMELGNPEIVGLIRACELALAERRELGEAAPGGVAAGKRPSL